MYNNPNQYVNNNIQPGQAVPPGHAAPPAQVAQPAQGGQPGQEAQVDPVAAINNIAKEFVNFYYQTFDSKRENLKDLYRPMSTMNWEGTRLAGTEAIVEKLTSLPFTKVAHKITTTDALQSLPNVPAVVIMVTGQLLVDDETKPQQFSQTFQLVNDNGFFIFNEIFRLNYA